MDDEEDFIADDQEVDDETTMAAEEKLPRDMSYQEEINLLEAEANLSIEDQRSKYGGSEEHTSELQSHSDLVCRLLLEKKKKEKRKNKDKNKTEHTSETNMRPAYTPQAG